VLVDNDRYQMLEFIDAGFVNAGFVDAGLVETGFVDANK